MTGPSLIEFFSTIFKQSLEQINPPNYHTKFPSGKCSVCVCLNACGLFQCMNYFEKDYIVNSLICLVTSVINGSSNRSSIIEDASVPPPPPPNFPEPNFQNYDLPPPPPDTMIDRQSLSSSSINNDQEQWVELCL